MLGKLLTDLKVWCVVQVCMVIACSVAILMAVTGQAQATVSTGDEFTVNATEARTIPIPVRCSR